jgi:hypothetical protein
MLLIAEAALQVMSMLSSMELKQPLPQQQGLLPLRPLEHVMKLLLVFVQQQVMVEA